MLSGHLLREARKRAGFSQRLLAKNAGTSQAAIQRYEKGGVVPSLETLRRLVKTCGLDLRVGIDTPLDPHDVGMLEHHLAMTPEERISSVKNMNLLLKNARRA